ncbi:unnamed protein product [Trichobilharzia regenti]|nr:unnamed protein product [Trichobilharzia regenti]
MPIQHLNRDVVNHSPTPSTPTTTTTTTTSGSEYKVLIAITVPTRHWKVSV